MRRVLLATTAAIVLSLSLSASAQAKCGTACLNHRVRELSNGLTKAERMITSLNRTVSAQGQTIAQQGQTIAQQQQTLGGLSQVGKKVEVLYECLFEVPITEFGEPGGPFGYIFQFENEKKELKTEPTSALDVPFEGEPVGAWFLIDGCNTTETAGLKTTTALAPPAASLHTLLQPQKRLFP